MTTTGTRAGGRRCPARAPRALLVVAALSITVPAVSAEEAPPPVRVPDGITVRTGFGVGNQTVQFNIEEADLSARRLELGPNVPLFWSVGVDWGRFGLSANVNLPETIEDVERRGRSDYVNVQFQSFSDRFAVEVAIQQHEGMYITNSADFSETIDDLRVPDLRLTNFTATFLRARNPNYSLAAAYRHNAWVERSSASFVWLLSAGLNGITSSSGPADAIPAAADTIWSDSLSIRTLTLTAGAGFGALVSTRGGLFLAPLAALGIGSQSSGYTIGDEDGSEVGAVPTVYLKLGAGLNSQRWIAVVDVQVESRTVSFREFQASQGSALIKLSVGYRMGRPWQRGAPSSATLHASETAR